MTTLPDVPTERVVSKDQARSEIAALVRNSPGMDYYDIAMRLDLNLWFTIEVCDEMLADGGISSRKI